MVRLRIDAAQPDAAAIAGASAVIRAGGVVAFPTDTLYGLAADPFNRDAVRRVFAIKGRAPDQALPLVAASVDQVTQHIGPLSPLSALLVGRFWPGPLTLLLNAPATIVEEAIGGTGRVGIRVPSHRVAVELCRACDRPLTATSANITGQEAPADGSGVTAAFGKTGNQIDLLLDAGRTAGGPPSTIVDVTSTVPRLVRAGAIPWDTIRACLNL